MNPWGTAAGAFVGTLILTTILRAASELKLTRMDLPFLLGSAVSTRPVPEAVGFVMHFLAGQLFALGYFWCSPPVAAGGWRAAGGELHSLFAGSALVNILVPLVHPRMGSRSPARRRWRCWSPRVPHASYGVATPWSAWSPAWLRGDLGRFTAMAS